MAITGDQRFGIEGPSGKIPASLSFADRGEKVKKGAIKGGWKLKVARELRAAGMDIDLNSV